LATLVLLRVGCHPVAAERGVAWLRKHQAKDGSWATYRPGVGDVGCVSVTAHALDTMRAVGDSSAVQKGLDWLETAQRADGSWEDLWLARKTYGTACALTALARAGRRSQAVKRGTDWLRKAQNPDGGWGETQAGHPASSTAEQTAFATQALRACGEDADAGIAWLRARQRADGGWDATPVGIYWEVIGGYANPLNAWVFPIFALTESR
jgi:squalene-hopene/tetraprenyl-beta-curcumene cyclase